VPPGMLRGSFQAALSFLVLASSPSLAAQSTRERINPSFGISVDRFIYENDGTTAMSVRFADLRPGRVGTEVGLSIFPDALSIRSLLLAVDGGPAYSASGPVLGLLVKAGFSSLMSLGSESAFYPGVHLGGGLLLRMGKTTGIRLDVVRHYYRADHETPGVWSIGLGITALPRRAGQRGGGDAGT
jgi:hypothetical protein